MRKKIINTEHAPQAIGTYSQAVQAGDFVYISGQIPLDPQTMEVNNASFEDETHQVFQNLKAVTEAAGGQLSDAVKLTIYLTDLSHFATVNEIMAQYFSAPFPARAAIGIASLPKAVRIEIDAVLYLP